MVFFRPNTTIQRPSLAQLDPVKDTLIFQELELDHYVGNVYAGMPGPQTGQVTLHNFIQIKLVA